jgi:hypothetical protein
VSVSVCSARGIQYAVGYSVRCSARGIQYAVGNSVRCSARGIQYAVGYSVRCSARGIQYAVSVCSDYEADGAAAFFSPEGSIAFFARWLQASLEKPPLRILHPREPEAGNLPVFAPSPRRPRMELVLSK